MEPGRGADHRRDQGRAGSSVLHACVLQQQTYQADGCRRILLASDHDYHEHERLPDADVFTPVARLESVAWRPGRYGDVSPIHGQSYSSSKTNLIFGNLVVNRFFVFWLWVIRQLSPRVTLASLGT